MISKLWWKNVVGLKLGFDMQNSTQSYARRRIIVITLKLVYIYT